MYNPDMEVKYLCGAVILKPIAYVGMVTAKRSIVHNKDFVVDIEDLDDERVRPVIAVI